jgi:hypothetical protein
VAEVVSFADRPMQAMSMDERKRAVPAYTIEPLKRKTIISRAIKDEIGFRVVPTEVEVDGYLVRTLRGDSVFLSQDEVARMRLDRNLIPLFYEGGDDTPAGVQSVNAALSNKQKLALDAMTQLIESNPNIVDQLLANNEQYADKED